MSTLAQRSLESLRPKKRHGLVGAALLGALLSLLWTAPSMAQQCNGGGFTDPGTGAPNLPPLNAPFAFGDNWIVGGNGSFFGNGWHCNQNNDYYATDWNRSGGGNAGQPVYPVAAGVVKQAYCSNSDGYGCRVVIEHQLGGDSERFRSLYAHLQTGSLNSLVPGDVVVPWMQIGKVGNTGQPGMADHLHLGFKSYHSGAWYSKCNDPKPGSSLCWSTEAPEAPQSRKPRSMWKDKSTSTVDRATVTDYATISSGNRPRIFVPGIMNQNGWDTNVYVRNLNGSSHTVEIRVYNASGSQVYNTSRTLNANGSWKMSFGTTVVGGTAVVLGQSGKDMTAVARTEKSNSAFTKSFAAYEGVEQPMVKQQVAIFQKDNYDIFSRVFLFNPDASSSVNATLAFSGPIGSCSKTVTIGAMDTYTLDAANNSQLPSCVRYKQSYGTLTVTAKIAGTNDPGVLAVTAFQEHRVGNDIDSFLAVATKDTSSTLYVPLIQNDNYGILSGIGANRAGGSGNLNLTYHDVNGTPCQTDSWSSWPVVHAGLPKGSGCNGSPVLSAKLHTSSKYVTGQFNQTQGLKVASSYPAVANPTWNVYVPYLDTGAAARGIQIQNTSGSTISGYIRYYDDNGTSKGSQYLSIGARRFSTLVGSIPSGATNAKIEMNGNIAVIVNNSMPAGTADHLSTYTAPGRR